MLDDWYFCCAIRLAPRQTAAYLDILQTLRSPTASRLMIRTALAQLEEAEPWMVIYALPAILASTGYPVTGDGELTDEHLDAVLDRIVRSNPQPLQDSVRQLVRGAVAQQATDELMHRVRGVVDGMARQQHSAGRPARSGEPYLDLAEHCAASVVLTVLLDRWRDDPERVAELCTGPARLDLVDQALTGDYGRHALLTSARLLARAAPERRAPIEALLWQQQTGSVEIEPDLMLLLAETMFAEPAGPADAGDWLEAIETEAITCLRFAQHRRRHRNRDARPTTSWAGASHRMFDGPPSRDADALSAVLWHMTLWRIAARHCPVLAAERLSDWWQAPDEWRPGEALTVTLPMRPGVEASRWQSTMSSLLALRLPGNRSRPGVQVRTGMIADVDAEARSAMVSPWLRRGRGAAGETAGDATDTPDYPTAEHPIALLRLLAGVDVAVDLLRAPGVGPRPYLLGLMLHAADVFGQNRLDSWIRRLQRGEVTALKIANEPLAGLLFRTGNLVQRVGTAMIPEIPPEWFATFLDGALDPDGPVADLPGSHEARKLLTRAGPTTAVKWIQDAASGASDPDDGADQSRWLHGAHSPARALITTAVPRVAAHVASNPPRRVDDDTDHDPLADVADAVNLPVQIAVELFGPRLRSTLVPRGTWSWERLLERGPRSIKFRQVLLAPPLTAADWVRYSDSLADLLRDEPAASRDARQRRDPHSRLAVLIERLAALLSAPYGAVESEHQASWVNDWLLTVAQINDVQQLPRNLRMRLLDLFRLDRPAEPGANDLRRQILETTVYLIAEFAADTPRAYAEMFKALVNTAAVSGDSRDSLRFQWLYALHQRRSRPSRRGEIVSPWDVARESHTHGVVQGMIEKFICDVGDEARTTAHAPVRQRARQLWHRLEQASTYRWQSQQDADDAPDPRLVIASLHDPASDDVRTLTLPVRLDRTADGRPVRDPHRDRADGGSRRTPGGSLVLGVVCERPDAQPGPTMVNCGLGEPVRVSTPAVEVNVGDPVAVELRSAAPGEASSGVVVALAAAAQQARAYPATLHVAASGAWHDTTPRISVAGFDSAPVSAEEDRAEAARRWDPDLSRVVRRSADLRLDARAQWEDDAWMPVDRSFAELLATDWRFAGDRPGPQSDTEQRAEVLIMVGPGPERGSGSFRVLTEPGVCYLLRRADWTTAAWDELHSRHDADDLHGLLVYVGVAVDRRKPVLRLLDGPPPGAEQIWPNLAPGWCDDRNVRWRAVFAGAMSGASGVASQRRRQSIVETRYADGRHILDLTDLGSPEDHVRDLATLGFPAVLTIDMAESHERMRCTLSAVEDGLRQARLQGERVPERTLTDARQSPVKRERFTRLVKIQEGDTLTLRRITDRDIDDHVRALTNDGLSVSVPVESLTMEPVRAVHHDFVKDREVEVSDVEYGRRRRLTTLDVGQLLDPVPAAERQTAQRWLHGRRMLSGLIVTWPADPAHPQASCLAWVELNERIVAVDLPLAGTAWQGSASRDRKEPTVGDLLVLTHGESGEWHVELRPRTIHAVARWRLKLADEVKGKLRYLGFVELGDERVALAQSATQPVLVRLDIATDSGWEHLTTLDSGTLRPASGRIALRNAKARVFGAGSGTYRARVWVGKGRDTATLFGYVPGRIAGPAQLVDVQLTAKPCADSRIAVVLHRMLNLSPIASTPSARIDTEQENRRKYQQWLQEGDYHTGARLLSNREVELTALSVEENGHFVRRLPLLDDEPSWVTTAYDKRTARVYLTQGAGGSWAASCRQATPYDVDDFVMAVRALGSSMVEASGPLRVDTYFAGTSQSDGERHYRFEWGYGHTTSIPESRIRVHGTTGRDAPMFVGDQLRSALFRRRRDDDGTTGHYLVEIFPERDIDWRVNIASVLFRQSSMREREQMVFRLGTHVDAATKQKLVDRVGYRETNPGLIEQERSHMRPLERIKRVAVLDDGPAESEPPKSGPAESGPGETDPSDGGETLATLDTERLLATEGRELAFRSVRELTSGMHVFMVAELIKALPNDMLLELRLPSGVARRDGPRNVTVSRRDFSHRESWLRRYYEQPDRSGGRTPAERVRPQDALKGWTFLVRIDRTDHHGRPGLRGSIKHGPPRSDTHLRDHLRSANGTCLAVVAGAYPDGLVRLELHPGVFFEHRMPQPDTGLLTGAVVRLSLDGARVELQPAMPSDEAYLDPKGRPAVLLPMNTLLKNEVKVGLADREHMFTIGGLPGVQVAAAVTERRHDRIVQRERHGEALMRTTHPKIATVGPRRQVTALVKGTPAGTMEVDDWFRPVVHTADGAGPRQLSWSDVSFRDANAREIQALWAGTTFRFHDERTGHWSAVDPVKRTATVTEARTKLSPPPCFFDVHRETWRLRYRYNELRRFGYPASLLIEGGLDAPVTGDWYPVAGVVRNNGMGTGLWIELSPGFVVEVSGQLLVGVGSRQLHTLHWDFFAVGDMVRLHARRGTVSTPDLLLLDGWRPGPRGAMPRFASAEARGWTWLPVTAVDADQLGMTLGVGQWSLVHPISKEALDHYEVGDVVALRPDNRIRRMDGDGAALAPGDVVSVGFEDGRLTLPRGLPGTVRVATGDQWQPQAGWLRRVLLDAESAEELVTMCGGALPLMVASADTDTVSLGWPRHVPMKLFADRLMYGRPLGRLGDHLIIRVGSALHRLPAGQLVPGMPDDCLDQVLARVGGAGMWLHTDPFGRLQVGLPAVSATSKPALKVAPVEVIDAGEATGVLCRDPDDQRLYWLPADETSWVNDITADELRKHVQVLDLVEVATLPNGSVSQVAVPAVRRWLQSLRLGDQMRVVQVTQDSRGRKGRRVLARPYLSDILLELEPEVSNRAAAPAGGHDAFRPQVVEVSERDEHPSSRVVVVPQGKRKSPIDLPGWLPTVLQQCASVKDGVVTTAESESPRFRDYGTWYTDGRFLQHAAPPAELIKPAEAMLYAAGAAARPETPDADLISALGKWLNGGRVLARGQGGDGVDLAPLLGAVLVADTLHRRGVPWAGRTAVHLGWLTGVSAARSLHVEPLVRHWLKGEPQHTGLWLRLLTAKGNLAKSVDARQRGQLLLFCRGVTSRQVVARDLKLIALGLQSALGQPPEVDELVDYAPTLSRLAGLGRALTPPGSSLTAQPSLLDGQVRLLTQTLDELIRGGLPLAVLVPRSIDVLGSEFIQVPVPPADDPADDPAE